MKCVFTASRDAQLDNVITKAYDTVLSNQYGFLQVQENSFVDECVSAAQYYNHCKHILVLGIGGSALGVQSVIEALQKNPLGVPTATINGKKITVLDTVDPEVCAGIFESLVWEETLINVISKSGSTLETMLQLSLVQSLLHKKGLSLDKHLIVTTETESLLYDYAVKHHCKTLSVPKTVGGRFSILTPVGMFPLTFVGVHVSDLLSGAEHAIQKHAELIKTLVSLQFFAYKREQRNMLVLMTYHKRLIRLLDWYRQLLSESIGKNLHTGITPLLAFGSTDQHSQMQLYAEGPQDKLIFFLSSPRVRTEESSLLQEISDTSYEVLSMPSPINIIDTQTALFEGTKKGLELHNRPYVHLELPEITEQFIGEFFMIGMVSIAVLAELLHVNAFDQPGVEEGKIQAKKILLGE